MPQLNVGFAGFGYQAKQHAEYLVENCLDKVKIIAICDILHKDFPSVQRDLDRFGLSHVPVYTISADAESALSDISSVEKLLENHPELDAAIISTPNAKHYYQTKACLERQVHVLVDKPLVLTYDHGKQLVELASNSRGPYLVVSSQRRYEDVYKYAKKIIDAGELGMVININSIISQPLDWGQGWRRDPELAGGETVWGLGWHALDTIIYLIGRKAIAVDAHLHYPEKWKVERYANALILFEKDVSVTLTVNLGAPKGSVYERLQIWGTQGTLTLDRFKPVRDIQAPVVTHQASDGRILIEPALVGALAKKWAPTEAFINLLTSLKDPNVDPREALGSVVSTGADSLETVRVIEAIYQSYSNRERIYLR